MNSPDKITLRCEVLSFPKQVREILKTSERAEQVALGLQAQRPGAVGATLAGVSFCFEPSIAYHVPLGPEEINSKGILQELRPLLSADGPPKVMHDAKPGLMVLAQRGVMTGTPAFDTLLAAFLLDGKAHTLEELIADRLGLSPGERAARGSQERTRNVCVRAEAVLLQVLNFGAMLWALITYASASKVPTRGRLIDQLPGKESQWNSSTTFSRGYGRGTTTS